MERIKRFSRFVQIIFIIVFILLPIITILSYLFINQIFTHFNYTPAKEGLCIKWPISSQGIGIAIVGAMISTGLIMRIFYLLIRLFGLYTRGIIFARENVQYIRSIGYAIIWWQILSIPSAALILKGLSDGADLTFKFQLSAEIFIGLIIIFVSWVMDEGRKLQEEQSLII